MGRTDPVATPRSRHDPPRPPIRPAAHRRGDGPRPARAGRGLLHRGRGRSGARPRRQDGHARRRVREPPPPLPSHPSHRLDRRSAAPRADRRHAASLRAAPRRGHRSRPHRLGALDQHGPGLLHAPGHGAQGGRRGRRVERLRGGGRAGHRRPRRREGDRAGHSAHGRPRRAAGAVPRRLRGRRDLRSGAGSGAGEPRRSRRTHRGGDRPGLLVP